MAVLENGNIGDLRSESRDAAIDRQLRSHGKNRD